MSTAKRTINITDMLGEHNHWMNFPIRLNLVLKKKFFPSVPEGHSVDRFLRTKCLRCHIGSESPHRPGDYRASGCSSCHMVYSNDGISLSHDRAIQKTQRKNKNLKSFYKKVCREFIEQPTRLSLTS
ncbi:MAG: hypothetical protein CM1200mP16_00390 [Nitrospina sp.]|nr:MAG: hypothetical protein CM1200mP16_00390 [Nitrospina sp.]